MSDLAATNCGGGCSFNDNDNRCGCGNLIWIIILLFFCGNNSSFFNNDCDNGCGHNNCLWILILLFCCGGFGCGC